MNKELRKLYVKLDDWWRPIRSKLRRKFKKKFVTHDLEIKSLKHKNTSRF